MRQRVLGAAIAEARPRVVAALAAQFRDLDLAEEGFSAAVEACLSTESPPSDPAAWLYRAGRRKVIDLLRKRNSEAKVRDAIKPLEADLADIIELPDQIPDERLRLMFICCHPAFAPEARVALCLKIVCGMPTAALARAFLVGGPTMYQRLTRAKAKVAKAGIPFETPHRREWPDRIGSVLETLEIAHSVAYRDSAQGDLAAELAPEVERLALMLCDLLPDEPEVLGFAVTVLLTRSREAARVGEGGIMVPLSEQDTAKWDRSRVEQAQALADRAIALGKPGPHQALAAIHLAHASRLFTSITPWADIVKLANTLAHLKPSPVVGINRAVAIGRAEGASAGLAALEELDADRLRDFLPYQAAHADLKDRMGRTEEAREAFERALELNPGRAERLYLEARLAKLA